MQESHHAFNRAKKHPTNENLTEFKRKRANFRRIIKETKKTIMEKLHNINKSTNTNICSMEKIKSINGSKPSTNIQFLESDDGQTVTQAHDIANTLAKQFQENSNNINSPHPTIIYNNIHHDLIHNDNNSPLNSHSKK